MTKGIEKLPGYSATERPMDAIQRALSEIADHHGLTGLVFIQFELDRVGCLGDHAFDDEGNG